MQVKNLADHDSRPIEIAAGDGCYLFDTAGKKYLDFVAGWCVGNVGWKRQEIAEALRKQADRGIYSPAFLRYPEQEEFARLLVEHSPNPKLARVFRCTSGSEAVDFAIKCARAATGKKTIVSVDHVYHGHTYGAASVGSACGADMAPCVPGFLKIPLPHPAYGAEPAEVIKEFERLAKKNRDIAAFLTDPSFHTAGIIVPPPDFLSSIERICREHGILFIMDEVASGFGRCGKLFASDLYGVKPDILCLGKGMTSGYSAMGAAMVTEEIFQASRDIPRHSTFGWTPTDLAAARANVEIIIREKLWENAERVGKHLLGLCKELESLPFVAEARGVGLLAGVEIVTDKRSRTPDYRKAVAIQDACADYGLIIETAGHVLFMSPPLTLTEAQAEEGFEILKKVMNR